MSEKKLFCVVLGGRADGCQVELHDVVFVIGETLESTYPQLVEQWFGNKKRLHIDSTIELTGVDGYQISIRKERPSNQKKIFFVNFGAYREGYFGEVHENKFYVAESKPEVLARAKKELCGDLIEAHCDDNLIIEDIISVNAVDDYYIHLAPTSVPQTLTIRSGYRPLKVA